MSEGSTEEILRKLVPISCVALTLLAAAAPAGAFRPQPLDPRQEKILRDNYATSVQKLKGPYTENFCVCPDGRKIPVRSSSGALGVGCKDALFCAAFRAAWGQALADQRVYIANIFSRDLYLWDSFPDHNDLVRGYILEQFFTSTNPNHKFAQLKAFGGLSGAEYETAASARFFERYLDAPEFNDNRDFLLAYELQKRYLVRADLGQIEKVRALSVRIQKADPKFKPLRDAVHNQISPSLVPKLIAARDAMPAGVTRSQVDELIAEIRKLTSLDESALAQQAGEIVDPALREKVKALIPSPDTEPVAAITSLGQLMVLDRLTVAEKRVDVADRRRLVDLNVTAAGVIHQRGTHLLESGASVTAKQGLELLLALTDATYGTGLLGNREREAASSALKEILANPKPTRADFAAHLAEAERAVEWAQSNAVLAFAEVAPAWNLVMPQTSGIRDDILRSSPLLLYAQVARRLDDYAEGSQRLRHEIFGAELDSGVRALNPGLALGKLRVAPKEDAYRRDDIVALPETPADLDPAAGILTQGEGNVLSHVQLLARALGIPNVVVDNSTFQLVAPHNDRDAFFIVTPGGRVILKEAAAMTAQDRSVYEEYTRNQARRADGSLGSSAPRLHIDRNKIDLSRNMPIDLDDVRRSDSGVFCGPKAAYLGELKHSFPDHVARGIVVPFGAYYDHYRSAEVIVPDKLKNLSIARAREPLPEFTERTYKEFFDERIKSGDSEKELAAWITPRLEIIRNSIRQSPLSPQLEQAIKAGLARDGLLKPEDDTQTVGCFVRSDTNVEDLDNFNGAGLNLTVFNRKSLDDIYSGLKEVWASPFEFRSFSWRQTLIDDPLWVLSSVVILEAIPNDKSGVLVTADVNDGDMSRMTVATSEGVGGAVDGTSAETLIWSPKKVELVSLFKSPWRNQLQPGGGTAIVPASGSETVLSADELAQIVGAGQKISASFAPAKDPAGKPRPWDIEFGFQQGKLWLFQCRPFLGNDELKNIPALAPLESTSATVHKDDILSLQETLK